MSTLLKIEMIIISLLTFVVVLKMLKNKNINTKYSVLWFTIPIMFLLFVLFSNTFSTLSHKLGFEVLSNFVFFIAVGLLFIICFSLTVIITRLNQKVILLTQEIALLKKEQK